MDFNEIAKNHGILAAFVIGLAAFIFLAMRWLAHRLTKFIDEFLKPWAVKHFELIDDLKESLGKQAASGIRHTEILGSINGQLEEHGAHLLQQNAQLSQQTVMLKHAEQMSDEFRRVLPVLAEKLTEGVKQGVKAAVQENGGKL